MKAATTAARDTIKKEYAVYVKPRVRAEWEYNRFAVPTVTITPAQDTDEEWQAAFGYPDTIAEPNRPRTGIAKARTGSNTVKPLGDFRDSPQAARFYPSGVEDVYNYWASVQRSGAVDGGGGSYAFTTPVVVTVTYDAPVLANKVVLGFETSYAKPKSYTLQVSANGTTWTTIATNSVIDSAGQVTLWNGDSGWSTTADYDSLATIKAVRVTVSSMNTANAHLDVLQLGARLENDLSDFVVNYSSQMEVSDHSFIAPMGKASSNTGSISLSNIDGRFNNYNADSLYYGLIDKKVRFTVDLGIDATPQSGSKYEYIREFVMWAEAWGGQDQATVSVDLKDSSVFLQEMECPVVFFENATVGAIAWLIMDRVGMSNYLYSRAAEDYGQVVPFYWPTDDSTTVWDEFAGLAEATQTAIYFDENDVLQIRARKHMYNVDKTVDWNLDAVPNGTKLPDVIETETSWDLETNSVDIKYQPAAYADLGANVPKMETAWEPEEDTVILRASTMQKNLLSAGTDLWISQADALIWPYESTINIRGEILSFKGKEYGYYQANGVLAKKVIFTTEEKAKLDELNPGLAWKNAFTGRFIVTERGMWGSIPSNHYVWPNSGYTDLVTRYENTLIYDWTGSGRTLQDGYLRLTNNPNALNDIHLCKPPAAIDETKPVTWYGTRVRIPSGVSEMAYQGVGLFLGGGDTDAGFYIELATTVEIVAQDRRETDFNEVHVIGMPNSAAGFRVAPGLGVQFNVIEDKWYDIDAKLTKLAGGSVSITVYIDGVFVGIWTATSGQVPTNTGRFGMFVHGRQARADFEYIYALNQDDLNPPQDPEQSNFLDLREGSYVSGFIQREYKYNFRSITPAYRNSRKSISHFPQRIFDTTSFFDEFSPIVHEIREFDVKFKDDARPVGHSYLYVSNPQVECLYYESDAFGARFMLANASRHNAYVKGDDDLTLGVDDVINQTMFIYGRAVYQGEEKTVTKRDEASIRKRGATKTEVTSRYVQTDEMANELSQWIIDLWATGVDEVNVKTFGNPFLQLGDLVTINHPTKGMAPATHKYFIVSINNNFSEGYTTELILRRARV